MHKLVDTKANNKYEDIINLPHHVSRQHPQMSMEARAAQFAPFAALTGYGDEVRDTGRLTDQRIELDEELKTIINNKLQIIQEQIALKPKLTITYFVPDKKKSGGEYVTITGIVKKIDTYNQLIIFTDNMAIPINEIIKIKGNIIKDNE